MIKVESVVLNKESFTKKQIFSFLLNNKKINIVFSENKDTLNELNLVINNYNKVYSGSIIYDNVEFSKLNPNQKSYFIKKYIGTISDFDEYHLNKTVLDYLIEIGHCLDLTNKRYSLNLIKQKLELFEIEGFKNIKIINLNPREKIKLLILQSLLNNPKYVFIDNIDNFINNYGYELTKEMINKYLLGDDIIVSIFSSVEIIGNDFHLINLEKLKANNNLYYYRDNSDFNKEAVNKTNYKNLLFFYKKILSKNIFLSIIWFLVTFLLTGILFLIFNNKNHILNPFNGEKLFDEPWKETLLKISVIAGNIIYTFLFSFVFYLKNNKRLKFWLNKGLNLLDLIKIYSVFIIIFWLIDLIIVFSMGIGIYFQTNQNFNWSIITLLNIFFLLSYLFFFVILILVKNKKFIKLNDSFF